MDRHPVRGVANRRDWYQDGAKTGSCQLSRADLKKYEYIKTA